MSPPNDCPSDRWIDAHLEAYVDGALSPEDQARFEAGLRADPAWQSEVDHARSIRTYLRSQTPPSAPADLTDTILQRAAASALAAREKR
jgi:anti-sigma factor RsiW